MAEKTKQLRHTAEQVDNAVDQIVTLSPKVEEAQAAATNAAKSASDAAGSLSALNEALKTLPDGSAVSATVAQHTTQIGNLNNLQTTDKSNLVSAINEAYQGSGIKEQVEKNESAITELQDASRGYQILKKVFEDRKKYYSISGKGEKFTYVSYSGGQPINKFEINEGNQYVRTDKVPHVSGNNVFFVDDNDIIIDFFVRDKQELKKVIGQYLPIPNGAKFIWIIGEDVNVHAYDNIDKETIGGIGNAIKLDGTFFSYINGWRTPILDTSVYKFLFVDKVYSSASNNVYDVYNVKEDNTLEYLSLQKDGAYRIIPNDVNRIIINLDVSSEYCFLTDEKESNISDYLKETLFPFRYKDKVGESNEILGFTKFNYQENASSYDAESKILKLTSPTHGFAYKSVSPIYETFANFENVVYKKYALVTMEVISIDEEGYDKTVVVGIRGMNNNNDITVGVGDVFTVVATDDGRATGNNIISSSINATFRVLSEYSFSSSKDYPFYYLRTALLGMDSKTVDKAVNASILLPDMSQMHNRLVAFGDSLTEIPSGWVGHCANKLGMKFTNLGISGSKPAYNSNLSPTQLAKIPSDVGVVVITGGWNAQPSNTVVRLSFSVDTNDRTRILSQSITTSSTCTKLALVERYFDNPIKVVGECEITFGGFTLDKMGCVTSENGLKNKASNFIIKKESEWTDAEIANVNVTFMESVYEYDKDNVNTMFGGVCNAINYIRENFPWARIILATASNGGNGETTVRVWPEVFRIIAQRQNIQLADVSRYGEWEAIKNDAYYDGLHVSPEGGRRTAAIIADAIKKVVLF